MKGDFTRDTFVSKKHFNSVRMQQGRVQLDADWNEQSPEFAIAAPSCRSHDCMIQNALLI